MEINSFTSSSSRVQNVRRIILWLLLFGITFYALDNLVFRGVLLGVESRYRIIKSFKPVQILAVGSSHVEADIWPDKLTADLSKSAVKIAISGADMKTRIAIIEEYLQNVKVKPDVILLETDRYAFHPTRYQIQKEVLLPYWHVGMFHELLKEAWGNAPLFITARIFKSFSANEGVPVFFERVTTKIISLFDRIEMKPASKEVEKNTFDRTSSPQIKSFQGHLFTPSHEIDSKYVEVLERFLRDSADAKQRIILLDTPNIRIPGTRNDEEFEETRKILKSLALKYGVFYERPFSDEEKTALWFDDSTHLNTAGSVLFTQKLAREITHDIYF